MAGFWQTELDIIELDIVVVDSSFCAQYGGQPTKAQGNAASIVAETSIDHFEPIGIKLQIKSFMIHCGLATDRIKNILDSNTAVCGSDGDSIIKKFRTHVANNNNCFVGDLGCACLNQVCQASGWNTGISEMTFTEITAYQAYHLAHELGHSLNANHNESGLMGESWCTPCTFSPASQSSFWTAITAARSQCIHQESNVTPAPTNAPKTTIPAMKPASNPTPLPTSHQCAYHSHSHDEAHF
jgi:hypothetical protein